ncbi:MAG: hypothetical protein ACOYXU_11975 [Nitrospirota bacterium]
MSRTRQDLETKLKKKWLSSNAVREGLLTSLILTLQDAGQTDDVEGRVDRAAQDAFKQFQADEEYAPPTVLREALALIDAQLGVARLPSGLADRHREVCVALLAKVDQQSGYR